MLTLGKRDPELGGLHFKLKENEAYVSVLAGQLKNMRLDKLVKF